MVTYLNKFIRHVCSVSKNRNSKRICNEANGMYGSLFSNDKKCPDITVFNKGTESQYGRVKVVQYRYGSPTYGIVVLHHPLIFLQRSVK